MKRQIVFFLIMCLLMVSCAKSSKSEADKISELRDSVKLLTSELDSYKYSAEKIVGNMKTAFEEKNFDYLSQLYSTIIEYHPEAEDAIIQGKEILNKATEQKEKERIEAQKKIEKEKVERLKAVSKLKKETDDISGITWYYQPYFTHYNNINRVSIYMGKDTGKPWVRLKMSYDGDSWIFFKTAYLYYDGRTIPIEFDHYKDYKSDNGDGSVWEWIDVLVDDDLLSVLNQLSQSNVVKVRFSGKYTNTRTLSKSEVNGIKDVLLAYDVLIHENNY